MLCFLTKLLSWNVRGFGKPEKMRKIRGLLQERKIDFLFFKETKKDGMSRDMVRSVWPNDELEFMSVDTDGSAGGLLCVWRPLIFVLLQCYNLRCFILLLGTMLPNFDCVFTNI